MKRLRYTMCVFLLIAASSARVTAWEGDVHYVLTWWLAVKAGLSAANADRIAAANLSRDQGWAQPATTLMIHGLLFGDSGASEDVRDKHFPVAASLPSPPAKRGVVAGGMAARRLVEQVIARPDGIALERLGHGLHALQDSWSHQGEPDSPVSRHWQIRPNLSWAHPRERGGWSSHDADITAKFKPDAIATARATYGVLVQFLTEHPNFRAASEETWPTLESLVDDFAEAATKEEKLRWLRANATGYSATAVAELSMLSIRGSSDVRRELTMLMARSITKPDQTPVRVVRAAAEFLAGWFVKQDPQFTAAAYVRWDRMRPQHEDKEISRSEVIEWCEKFMTMFLASDHGEMNELGHCDRSRPGYTSMPRVLASPLPTRGLVLRNVAQELAPPPAVLRMPVEVPIVQPEAITSVQLDGEQAWVLMFRLTHAPTDTIAIFFDNAPEPRVVRMMAIASH